MSLDPNQEKIIQQMITLERSLSRLYAIFAEQFPEDADFWGAISKEEEKHARLIEKLRLAEQKGLVFFDSGKIGTPSLHTIIDRLEKMIEKAQKGEFVSASAFAYAVDYEAALIEKNVFTHFVPVNEKVKNTLNLLQTETLAHVEKLKNIRNGKQR